MDGGRSTTDGRRRTGDRERGMVVRVCDAIGVDWAQEFVSAGEAGCHFGATYDVGGDNVSSLWALEGPD